MSLNAVGGVGVVRCFFVCIESFLLDLYGMNVSAVACLVMTLREVRICCYV
jgi:hypothetical protein